MPASLRLRVAGLALLLAAAPCARADAPAEAGAVPPAFRGIWAVDGRCQMGMGRLTLTAHAASLDNAPPEPVVLTPHDSPAGEDALHWAEEGEVDNFVLRHHPESIVHNLEGYGMGRAELLHRCPK